MSKKKLPYPLLPDTINIDFPPQVTTVDYDNPVKGMPAGMPFYYASFVGIWVYWLADIKEARKHFKRGDFKPYPFKDADGKKKALVAINYQTYTSHAGVALGTVNEVEFNICAYPTSDEGRIPTGLSVEQFLMGADQTNRIGLLRIHVPADNTIAVAAGRGFFGEPKFYAQFKYQIPCLNLPGVNNWDMYVFDKDATQAEMNPPEGKKPSKKHMIFHLSVPAIEMAPQFANVSPLALYTYVNGIPNGSHWQMLKPMEHYYPLASKFRNGIKMTPGQSKAGSPEAPDMAGDIGKLIGKSKPVGVQVFRSEPSCIEGAPFDVR